MNTEYWVAVGFLAVFAAVGLYFSVKGFPWSKKQ
jgi:ABC-type multidrug transport system permease subunit